MFQLWLDIFQKHTKHKLSDNITSVQHADALVRKHPHFNGILIIEIFNTLFMKDKVKI
jgi:hypothetical protein